MFLSRSIDAASRIENSGEPNMIHVSQETAALLQQRGKDDWLTPREAQISAKGKGMIQTYWLTMKRRQGYKANQQRTSSMSDLASVSSAISNSERMDGDDLAASKSHSSRETRLVDWNVEVLGNQLKKIIAMRDGPAYTPASLKKKSSKHGEPNIKRVNGQTVLDEVMEVIPLSEKANDYKISPELIDLGENVQEQLQDYVRNIASMYR